MVKCSAYGCENAFPNKTSIGLSFHRFPMNESTRKAWIENMKRQDWQPSSGSVLCSKHFKDHLLESSTYRTRLRPGAIPTLFNDVPLTAQTLRENSNNDCNDFQHEQTTSNTVYIEIVPDSTQTGWQLFKQEPEPLQAATELPSQKTGPFKSQPMKQSHLKTKKDSSLTRRMSERLRTDPTSKQNQHDHIEVFTNEFDIFGRFVATQLKNLSEEDAVLAQSEIQEVLIRYRLNKIKARYNMPATNVPSSVDQSEQLDGPSDSVPIKVEELILKCEPDSDTEICAGQ